MTYKWCVAVIDPNGYRLNVGIILCNRENKLLWARRIGGQDAWQFPQGGIKPDETPQEALFRELHEEIGLTEQHVSIIAATQRWLQYELPKRFIRFNSKPLCIGQKQIWYMLRLQGSDIDIQLNRTNSPEFDHWRWVEYWYPLCEVISFKKTVYENALKEFSPYILGKPAGD